MQPAYRYRARCARVIDGDTYELDVELGFHVRATVTVRLRGVDCPERGTEPGRAAAEYARRTLSPYGGENPTLVVETYRDRRSFARWVADIYLGDVALADRIIAAGHGRPA